LRDSLPFDKPAKEGPESWAQTAIGRDAQAVPHIADIVMANRLKEIRGSGACFADIAERAKGTPKC
jgi:hypothetical protein